MSFNIALRSEPFAVILLWILLLVGLSLGVLMLGFEVNELINLITALNMAAVVYYCWRYTGNGQSFLFLYVVLFALFLGGRFITPFLGYDYQANYISFGSGSFVGLDTHRTYAYLVNICLITFFLAALLGRLDCDPVVVNYGDRNAGFKLFLKIGFLVCLPLYFYKNYIYLKYVMDNGGYLAIYLSTDHLDKVGMIARAGALICLACIIARIFFSDTRREYVQWSMIFLAVFSVELAIGLRGKFFVTLLTLFFIYVTRFRRPLKISTLLLLVLVIASASVAIEIFRENKEESTLIGSLLVGFLHQQSISSDVVKGVIAFDDNLPGTGLDYLLKQFFIPFIHPTEVGSGWFLTDDLSQLVMPQAYDNGFGTGSSYLAELYLIGGFPLVFFFNLVFALFLKSIRPSITINGFIVFLMLIGFMYYPRGTLQEPLFMLFKYLPVVAAIYVMSNLFKGVYAHESSDK